MTISMPAYESTETMLSAVSMLQARCDHHIVLVDDGSGEAFRPYFDAAEARSCIVLHHDITRGKGAAHKTAFSGMMEKYPDEPIACADSDGQQNTNDILEIAEVVDPDSREITIAMRQFERRIPMRSRFGNRLMRNLFLAVTQVPLYDTQSGLLSYASSLLSWLASVGCDGFEDETNQLLHATRAGLSFREVLIQTVDINGNEGSHFRTFRDSVRIARCPYQIFTKNKDCKDYTILIMRHGCD